PSGSRARAGRARARPRRASPPPRRPLATCRPPGRDRPAPTGRARRRPATAARSCAGPQGSSSARSAPWSNRSEEGNRHCRANDAGPFRLAQAVERNAEARLKSGTGLHMRTIWNGSISFGLVNIPVGLALATAPKARQSDVSFRTLHRECGTPIRNKRWCPTHEREVGADEIVKGWEVAKGEFVLVDDADLEAIAQSDDSRSIDITRFVELDEVDPVYLDRTYYLSPAQAPAARRPYVLLLEAMKQSNMGAVGRFVLRGAEYFCLIRPKG